MPYVLIVSNVSPNRDPKMAKMAPPPDFKNFWTALLKV